MTDAMDRGDDVELRLARATVERVLGGAVASKATREFCVSFTRSGAPRPADVVAGFESLAIRSAPPAAPGPTIIEFARPVEVERRRGAGPATAAAVRTAAYRAMGPVYDEVERVSTGVLRSSSLTTREPPVSALLNQVCWLNRTIRTFAHPMSLSEVAHDDAVERLDVPRRLEAEAWQPNMRLIGLPALRAAGSGTGAGTIVAVIDSEISLRHPALDGRIVHRRNFTSEGWGSPHAHGTAVAGIIAADGDEEHQGLAPGVVIYNYKVLASVASTEDFGGTLALQQALEDGALVANCSWGVGRAGEGTSRVARAVDAAWALGMVVVKSAGNAGGLATMTSPADAAGVIVVGATDVDGEAVGSYSSRGPVNGRPGPHLVAPGGTEEVRIRTCAPGGGFAATGRPGTSFAAPHVSGAVVLLAEAHPEWGPEEIRDELVGSASPIHGEPEEAQGAGVLSLSL